MRWAAARLSALALSVIVVSACAPDGAGTAPGPDSTAPPPAVTAASDVPSATRQRAQVLSVTDGDTIRVSLDGRSVPVRYIGIDTPETVDPRQSVQCFGREAADANKKLVEGKMVELEKDVSETDKYDRLLRYVYVDLGGRAVMVNEELVRLGFAKSTSYPPDIKFQARFTALERDAHAANAGLWGSACAQATAAPTTTQTTASSQPATQQPTQPAALTVAITTSRYGLVAATTLAGASCTAQAKLPSGRISTDQDLRVTKTAGASGAVTWNYGVSSATNPGVGTHTVTCTLGATTRSMSATFTVN